MMSVNCCSAQEEAAEVQTGNDSLGSFVVLLLVSQVPLLSLISLSLNYIRCLRVIVTFPYPVLFHAPLSDAFIFIWGISNHPEGLILSICCSFSGKRLRSGKH